jgi:hypothetical protein
MALSFIEFFCPVVISMISMPKLYMSDEVEISPLCRYSGAIHPLESVNVIVIIAKIMGDTHAIYSVIRKPNNGICCSIITGLTLLPQHSLCLFGFILHQRAVTGRNPQFWHHVIIQQYVGRLKIVTPRVL